VHNERNGKMFVVVYRRANNINFFRNVSQFLRNNLNQRIKEAWITLKNREDNTCVEFNPKSQLKDEESFWAIQFGFIQELQLDAIKWTW